MRLALPLLVVLALAGCLGADHVFPDESAKVAELHVNAYAKIGQDGIVEITGHDAQNVTRAFHATGTMLLEEQHDPPEPPTYSKVVERPLSLSADSFSNPGDSPLHAETIARSTFPEAGTYRVTIALRIDGRDLPPAWALFYAQP